VGGIIAVLNLYLLYQEVSLQWLVPIAVVALAFSIWVMFFYHEKPAPEAA
jgi:hypothetical protein